MKIIHIHLSGTLQMTLEDGSVEILRNVEVGIDSPGSIVLGPRPPETEGRRNFGSVYRFASFDAQLGHAIQWLDDRADQGKAILEITGERLDPGDIFLFSENTA